MVFKQIYYIVFVFTCYWLFDIFPCLIFSGHYELLIQKKLLLRGGHSLRLKFLKVKRNLSPDILFSLEVYKIKFIRSFGCTTGSQFFILSFRCDINVQS